MGLAERPPHESEEFINGHTGTNLLRSPARIKTREIDRFPTDDVTHDHGSVGELLHISRYDRTLRCMRVDENAINMVLKCAHPCRIRALRLPSSPSLGEILSRTAEKNTGYIWQSTRLMARSSGPMSNDEVQSSAGRFDRPKHIQCIPYQCAPSCREPTKQCFTECLYHPPE